MPRANGIAARPKLGMLKRRATSGIFTSMRGGSRKTTKKPTFGTENPLTPDTQMGKTGLL